MARGRVNVGRYDTRLKFLLVSFYGVSWGQSSDRYWNLFIKLEITLLDTQKLREKAGISPEVT
jgi:hypothetical protein